MKHLIPISALCIISITLHAQDKYLSGIQDITKLSEKVLGLFAENQVSQAFLELQPYWPLPENELDDLQTKTLKYMNLFDENYGAPIGSMHVRDETIGDVALRKTYLLRYHYTAIRLIFTYYLSDEGWLLNAFKWDSDFDEEFRN